VSNFSSISWQTQITVWFKWRWSLCFVLDQQDKSDFSVNSLKQLYTGRHVVLLDIHPDSEPYNLCSYIMPYQIFGIQYKGKFIKNIKSFFFLIKIVWKKIAPHTKNQKTFFLQNFVDDHPMNIISKIGFVEVVLKKKI
jgi:hypothetical protein